MDKYFGKINQSLSRLVWDTDLNKASMPRVILIRSLQVIAGLHRELSRGELTLRAMGLVYTTLLSLVPLLAVSFSVLKAFGVHNQIEPLLMNFLEPLGTKGEEITANIIAFVENMRVGVLGSLGLAVLVYTVISLVQKIEDAFNNIWHDTPNRNLLRRFSDYLSVMLVGPVLVFSALGLTASMVSHKLVQSILGIEPFGTLFYYLGQIMPFILIIAAFTFVYVFIPNTKVRIRSALAGGAIAGVLWKTAGWGFALMVARSTNYDAIYSGFAILILFMIWLYVSWLILLLGAQMAFYHQNPQFLRLKSEHSRLSPRIREYLGYWLMCRIGDCYQRGEAPPSLQALASTAQMPTNLVAEILNALHRNNLLRETADEPIGYVPGRDPQTLSLNMIHDALRSSNENTFAVDTQAIHDERIESLMQRLNDAARETFGTENLQSLISSNQTTATGRSDEPTDRNPPQTT